MRFSDEHPSGYDRELSSGVLRDGELVAAVLVRKQDRRAVVETRGATAIYVARFNLPNALILDRPLAIAEATDMTEVVLTAGPAAAPETIRFARKREGSRQRTLRPWRWAPTA